MSSVSQFFGGRIKSIQRGVISITDRGGRDVTIIAVDTTKSILYHLGSPTAAASVQLFDDLNITVMLTLQNSTTIRANIGNPFRFSNAQVSWQLVEYF